MVPNINYLYRTFQLYCYFVVNFWPQFCSQFPNIVFVNIFWQIVFAQQRPFFLHWAKCSAIFNRVCERLWGENSSQKTPEKPCLTYRDSMLTLLSVPRAKTAGNKGNKKQINATTKKDKTPFICSVSFIVQ